MRQRRWLLVVVLGCAMAVGVLTGEATALTGNEYRALSPSSRLYYVIGVLDGWDVGGTLAKSIPSVDSGGLVGMLANITRCAVSKGMTQGQAQAIVDKYISEHPTDWHYHAAGLVFGAMNEACKP